MTPEGFLALFVALSGFVVAIYTQRNAASAERQKANTAAIQAETDARKARDLEVDAEFSRLRSENGRLSTSLTEVRTENDRLYAAQTELRRGLASRDEELANMRRELAQERARTIQMNAWVDVLVAAMKAAGIPIPEKPKTGPLLER